MYLFIFESIGTSELFLIGMVALIVFGPRKLPEMARTIGKTMADFKKTTNEFKSTWEREAEFYKEESLIETKVISARPTVRSTENNNGGLMTEQNFEVNTPEIKELDEEKVKKLFSGVKGQETPNVDAGKSSTETVGKRDWL